MERNLNQEENLNFFKKNGWVIEKNVFTLIEVENIKKQLEKFLKKNIKNYKGRDINFFNDKLEFENINSFHKMDDCKYIKKLALSSKIYEISKKYLNSNKPDLRACEFFAKPKINGLAAPIHQDNYYWCVNDANALTIWLALDDTREKNGAVYFYNGSHKGGILDHTESFAKGSSQKIKNINDIKDYKVVTPKLNVGDCIIHHSLTVHGSKENKSDKNRRGLTFQFKSDKSYYDENLKLKYEKSLNSQISNRN